MGTWGTGIFDNDSACDWAQDLAESSDLSVIEAALDGVLEAGSEYLEVDEATEALAAAEAIARLQGNWGVQDAYTERVDAWVKKTKLVPTPGLAQKAVRAIERVLLPPSELLELWEEAGDHFDEWRATVDDLRSRIRL